MAQTRRAAGLTLADARTAIGRLAGELPQAQPDVDLMLGFLAAAERGIVR